MNNTLYLAAANIHTKMVFSSVGIFYGIAAAFAATGVLRVAFVGWLGKKAMDAKSPEAVIAELQRDLTAAAEEAKRNSDPALFRQAQRETMTRFVESLASMALTIPAEFATKMNVLVIGDVSSGKSALLNTLFDLSLPVGIGHTTQAINVACANDSHAVWDTPGCNQDDGFYNVDSLNFIFGAARVAILYVSSVSTVLDVVRVARAIRKGPGEVICVRTMCDRFAHGANALTLQEETEQDRATLAAAGIEGVDIYLSAAVGPDPYQNNAIKAWMMQP